MDLLGLFDNYYDEVVYEQRLEELDASGNNKYNPPKSICVREVAGGTDYKIKAEGIDTQYTKEYQIPFIVDEGDRIGGRMVVKVEQSKDVFGNFHFCIVKVI